MDNVYLLTTDADVWPISTTIYDLPANADVLCTNAFHSAEFTHHGKTYKMLSMSTIGARIGTWRNITYRLTFKLIIIGHISALQ